MNCELKFDLHMETIDVSNVFKKWWHNPSGRKDGKSCFDIFCIGCRSRKWAERMKKLDIIEKRKMSLWAKEKESVLGKKIRHSIY